jgi:hypothetical protein
VNVPVLGILAFPLIARILLRDRLGPIVGLNAFDAATVALFVLCFMGAWLWWSVAVPRWRLWAYERVSDIPELKRRAVAEKLIWPDSSFFAKTESKSAAHAARERELEANARIKTVA